MTSDLLWLGLTVVFTAVVAGIAFANSKKTRARMVGQGGRLYFAIFMFIAPWTIGIAAIPVVSANVDLPFWAEFAVVVGLLVSILAAVELLFKPTRTFMAAYGPTSGEAR